MHTVYDMFKQYLIVLGFTVKMHILQITIFFKRRAAYTKGCYSQNMVRYLGKNTLCIQKNDVPLSRTYFTCLHIPCVLHLRKHNKNAYCEKGIACARGFIFDIEAD